MIKQILLIFVRVSFLMTTPLFSQEIKVVNHEELQKAILRSDKQLTVVNYWATWCMPCLAELPYFSVVEKQNKDEVRWVFVSFDRPKQIERMKEIIRKENLNGEFFLLDDLKNQKVWRSSIDENWFGAIPVTNFYKNRVKILHHPSAFTLEELTEVVQQLK